MRRFIEVCGVLLVLLFVGSEASAQGRGGAPGATGATGATGASGATGATGATGVPEGATTVEFDHQNDADTSYERHLSNGQRFYVVIKNTCPDVFSYDVRGIVREQKPKTDEAAAKGGKALETKVIPVVHDAKYGGYYVTIERSVPGVAGCDGAEKLERHTLMIFTPQQDWDLSFSGAFTVSSLSNPQYYLQPHPNDATKKQVQEDTGKSDAVNLGIGAFVHLFHQRLPWVAGAFGLGIREGNKMEYFLGGGLRASDKATINAGLVFGPVNRLPNGVDTTKPISNDNVLTDLPTRIARGFFVSISYSFINTKNRFEAPFAGSAPGTPTPPAAPAPAGNGGTGGGGGQNANNAATCTVTFEPASIEFAPAGEKKPVTVKTSTTGCPWNLTEKPGWLHVRTSGGTDAERGTGETPLSLEADANDTPNDRPAATVKIGNGSLPVTQKKRP